MASVTGKAKRVKAKLDLLGEAAIAAVEALDTSILGEFQAAERALRDAVMAYARAVKAGRRQ